MPAAWRQPFSCVLIECVFFGVERRPRDNEIQVFKDVVVVALYNSWAMYQPFCKRHASQR